jgi:hypothetical protein
MKVFEKQIVVRLSCVPLFLVELSEEKSILPDLSAKSYHDSFLSNS